MTIIYLHGFRSHGNSGKTQNLKVMFPKHRVVGCDYSPHSPQLAMKQLSDLYDVESNRKESISGDLNSPQSMQELVVIGTSLGGFWAQWMAHKFGVKALLINPSLHPDKTLPLGCFNTYSDPISQIEVTKQDRQVFSSCKVLPNDAKQLDCVVWIALDDELLDAQATIDELSGIHPVVSFEQGGHRFSQFSEMKVELGALLIES